VLHNTVAVKISIKPSSQHLQHRCMPGMRTFLFLIVRHSWARFGSARRCTMQPQHSVTEAADTAAVAPNFKLRWGFGLPAEFLAGRRAQSLQLALRSQMSQPKETQSNKVRPVEAAGSTS